MKPILTILVLSAAFFEYGYTASERAEKVGRSEVKILGQSGKIQFKSKPGRGFVVINFDEMYEVDKNNTVVGKTGRKKHSFKSFATQSFTFSPVVNYEYNGLKTKAFNFTSSITGTGATLNVQVYIFKESGEFVNGNESTTVNNGTLKFNIEITDWEFCNGSANCRSGEYGESIVFVIAVTSKSKPRKREDSDRPKPKGGKRRPKGYDLGDDTSMYLSQEVEIDGKLKEIPDDHVKFEMRGSKQFFIFRFPKFRRRILYDPMMQESGDSSDAARLGMSVMVFLGGLLAAILNMV